MRVTIVGIGGGGSHLAEWVARYLADTFPGATLTLVDGKSVREHNYARQAFNRGGNKAQVKAMDLGPRHPKITIETVTEFLTPENVDFVILEGDIVLVLVDNHATWKLIADVAARRQDIAVLASGNDNTWGSVFAHIRRGGKDCTPPLTQDHPEVEFPQDRRPDELSCEERAAAGEPQVFAANLMGAVIVFNALWRLTTDPDGFVSKVVGDLVPVETAYTEVNFDVHANALRPCRRLPATGAVVDQPQQEEEEEAA